MNKVYNEFLNYVQSKDRLHYIITSLNSNNIAIEVDYKHKLANIIVPSKTTYNKIVLTAHYDIYKDSMGFNDNGTGVAVLIHLVKNNLLPNNVEVVFTDKEETGYEGASYYVFNEQKLLHNILLNINVDIVGIGDTIYYKKYREVKVPKVEFKTYELVELPFNDSHAFNFAGIDSIIVMSGPELKTPEYDFVQNIFEYQHCGKYDKSLNDIQYISETQLENTVSFILETIKLYP